jgi:hypothetical protein
MVPIISGRAGDCESASEAPRELTASDRLLADGVAHLRG